MSSQINGLLPKPSLVEEPVFTGVVWGGMAISFLFVAFRVCVRLKSFRRLFLDDLFVILGWSMIFATTIIWHFNTHDMFLSTAVASGQLSLSQDPTYLDDTQHYLHASIAVLVLFYSSLIAIKMSFLLFFRRLTAGVNNKAQKIHWWTIFALVVCVWMINVGTLPYDCMAPGLLAIESHCLEVKSINFQRGILIANCVLDVLTDVIIITIPIAILWNVNVRRRQKLALAGLFSLTVITMIFAIVRVSVVSTATRVPDISWLYLWSAIEPPIAVIISCLTSFRALFTKQEERVGIPAGKIVKPVELEHLRRHLQSKPGKPRLPIDDFKTTRDDSRRGDEGDQSSRASDKYVMNAETYSVEAIV